jgi:hypothetical protein
MHLLMRNPSHTRLHGTKYLLPVINSEVDCWGPQDHLLTTGYHRMRLTVAVFEVAIPE